MSKRDEVKFVPSKGARISQENVEKYGSYLWDLQKANDGKITAPEVVQAAVPVDSPIHDWFEWDNRKAAGQYRIQQARILINSISCIIVSDGKEQEINAFENVKVTDNSHETRAYVTYPTVLSSDDYRKQILAEASGELLYWGKKYKQYEKKKEFKPLRPVFREIRKAERQLSV